MKSERVRASLSMTREAGMVWGEWQFGEKTDQNAFPLWIT
jgi:hypothetical protein